MARIVEFDGTNFVYKAPEGRDDISDLTCFKNGVCNVFAVELDEEERAEFERTGRIFISVMSGSVFHPIFVGTETTTESVVARYGPTWLYPEPRLEKPN